MLWTPCLEDRGIDFANPLANRLGVPAIVINDCSAMVEGLHWIEPSLYAGNFVVVLIGYGIGMGLFLDGRTFSGRRSSATEFGHTNHQPDGALCRCGQRGCIEAYAADYAIWRRATGLDPASDPHRFQPSEADMAALVERARAGDPAVLQAFEEAGQAIGYGLGRLFTITDPMKIVFTGIGLRAFAFLEQPIRSGLGDSLVNAMSAPFDYERKEDESALFFSRHDHGRAGQSRPQQFRDGHVIGLNIFGRHGQVQTQRYGAFSNDRPVTEPERLTVLKSCRSRIRRQTEKSAVQL